ncbi:hypothetical protein BJ742DRAFT_824820 [Cladochytrium replicatum]|nr:hypothetical protein BJ742DRAFT_824820 [Cladochytrium replicatum]
MRHINDDVLTNIFHHLPPDPSTTSRTAYSAAAVCKTWSHPALQKLYHAPTLTAKNFHSFLASLKNAPVSSIRHLDLRRVLAPTQSNSDPFGGSTPPQIPAGQMRLYTALLQMIAESGDRVRLLSIRLPALTTTLISSYGVDVLYRSARVGVPPGARRASTNPQVPVWTLEKALIQRAGNTLTELSFDGSTPLHDLRVLASTPALPNLRTFESDALVSTRATPAFVELLEGMKLDMLVVAELRDEGVVTAALACAKNVRCQWVDCLPAEVDVQSLEGSRSAMKRRVSGTIVEAVSWRVRERVRVADITGAKGGSAATSIPVVSVGGV